MTYQEQAICELQADVFEISLKRFKSGSPIFIARFMNCELVKELDNIDDPYNYISPNNIIKYLSSEFSILNKNKGNKYPIQVMRWIGYTYRAYSIIYKINSNKLYKIFNADKMLSLYETYHTFSPEQCVERMKQIADEMKPNLDDYSVFKAIKESSK